MLSGSDLLDTYIVVIFQDVGVSPQHLALLYQVRGGAVCRRQETITTVS